MKKPIAAIAVGAAAILLPTAVNAAEKNTDVVYYSEPEYVVVIPCDTEALYAEEITGFGCVGLSQARLGADMSVGIRLLYSGKLKSHTDRTQTITYSIVESSGRNYYSGSFHSSGEITELFIRIEGDEWEKAFSGEYSDTVCFEISYEKTDQSAEVKT